MSLCAPCLSVSLGDNFELESFMYVSHESQRPKLNDLVPQKGVLGSGSKQLPAPSWSLALLRR